VPTGAALANTCWVGAYDLGTDLRSMSMPISYDELVDTRYAMTGQSRVAGLETVAGAVAGYNQLGAGLVEETISAQFTAGSVQPVTMSPDGLAGSVGWMWLAKHFKLTTTDGPVGSLAPFSVAMSSARAGGGIAAVGAVRGRVLKPKGTISATGATGSVVQVGAVPSGAYLYAVVHTFAIGTSFTLQVQSDDNNGMSSPTTRATIGSITSAGGTWMTRVAGPITDDYWRINVSAVTGTSTIAVAIGIKH
jgi:hypothetical protein